MRYQGVTDGQVAEALGVGVSRQTVNGWANGRTKIPIEMEDGLAVLFDVPKEVMHLTPDAAVRWVLDHPSDLRISGKGWNPRFAGERRAA